MNMCKITFRGLHEDGALPDAERGLCVDGDQPGLDFLYGVARASVHQLRDGGPFLPLRGSISACMKHWKAAKRMKFCFERVVIPALHCNMIAWLEDIK